MTTSRTIFAIDYSNSMDKRDGRIRLFEQIHNFKDKTDSDIKFFIITSDRVDDIPINEVIEDADNSGLDRDDIVGVISADRTTKFEAIQDVVIPYFFNDNTQIVYGGDSAQVDFFMFLMHRIHEYANPSYFLGTKKCDESFINLMCEDRDIPKDDIYISDQDNSLGIADAFSHLVKNKTFLLNAGSCNKEEEIPTLNCESFPQVPNETPAGQGD